MKRVRRTRTVAKNGRPPVEAVVVVNRNSRETQAAIPQIHAAMEKFGIRIAAFHPCAGSSELAKYVRRAAKAGVEAIIVGGGDGTQTHAVEALAHSKTTLGVVPLGTGNSFAQSLGVPLGDVEAAIGIVAQGNVEKVDLGVVNGTHFANFATIGLSSIIAGDTPRTLKAVLGKAAYGIAGLFPLLAHDGFRAKIAWSGGKMTVRTQDVLIASGRYFGSTPVTPDADLTSGHLALFTVDDPTRFGALMTYLAEGRQEQTKMPDAHVIRTKELTVKCTPRQQISIDGSTLSKTPGKFSVDPKALRVYVPSDGIVRG